MSTNNNSTPEPVVMTFKLSPDVMDQALPHIRFLSALQGGLPAPADTAYAGPERRRRRAASDPVEGVPTYGEERMPKDEARKVLPEDHENVPPVETPPAGEDETRNARRGRIPGLYKLVDNAGVDAERLTPSALAIYRVMQARVRKAATAVDIANRLKMSQGTVGWALAELRKVGLVEYLPRAGGRTATTPPRKPKQSATH